MTFEAHRDLKKKVMSLAREVGDVLPIGGKEKIYFFIPMSRAAIGPII